MSERSQAIMNITLNGDPLAFAGTVQELLEQLDLPASGIAIERNRQIVPHSSWAKTCLADGDKLEIVQFVGGG